MEYLSKQRYDEIAAELNNLIDVVYPEVRDLVAETSAQGDRSENAGYREARRRQAATVLFPLARMVSMLTAECGKLP